MGKVDWEQLGRTYELAGGSIKNAVSEAVPSVCSALLSDYDG